MKKYLLLTILFFTAGPFLGAQSSTVIKDYILKYKDIAIQEMIRTGVPASITLAQGIHETEAGRSKLVLKSNNHFGIKCKSDWKGVSVSHDDDARGECFRKYADPFDSYKDHSDFLKTRSHYASLFTLDPTDFEGWAHGLKKAGYATNPKYPQILIRIINDYKLQDYTLVALGRKVDDAATGIAAVTGVKTEAEAIVAPPPAVLKSYPQGVFQINKTSVVYVPAGTSYFVIAQQHKIPLHRLFEFNDMVQTEVTPTDRLVFLGRKRREGATDFHTVTEGETLYDIAQSEGIQLESLLAYNFLRSDVPPRAGRMLNLKKGSPKTEVVSMAENKKPVLNNQSASTAGNQYEVHTVEAKQSLYAISKLYEVSIDDIMQWNGLESTDLKKGQQLRIYKK